MESLKNSTSLKEIFALEIGISFLLSSLLSIWLPCHTDLNHAWPHNICWAYFDGPLNVFSKVG